MGNADAGLASLKCNKGKMEKIPRKRKEGKEKVREKKQKKKKSQTNATKCANISNMFGGGALAASTSVLPIEQGGEVAGSDRQKHADRVREEAEEE